jgi:hypothetical protein
MDCFGDTNLDVLGGMGDRLDFSSIRCEGWGGDKKEERRGIRGRGDSLYIQPTGLCALRFSVLFACFCVLFAYFCGARF